jgi:hypothetical protein
MAEENDVLVTRTNRVEIDWPQLVGYYGGIGLALAAEIIEPPLALFIGAIPLIKMLKRPGASVPTRALAQLLEGAAVPVGGEAQSAIRIKSPDEEQQGKRQQRQPVTA